SYFWCQTADDILDARRHRVHDAVGIAHRCSGIKGCCSAYRFERARTVKEAVQRKEAGQPLRRWHDSCLESQQRGGAGMKMTVPSTMFAQLRSLFSTRERNARLQERLEQLRQRTPVPVFWLFGRTQSGKTTLVKFLTGAADAEVGAGFQPCTRF